MDLSTLNPFKKKENEFSFNNDSDLPSLSSTDNNSNSFNPSNSLPPLPDSNSSSNDFSQSSNSDFNSSNLSSNNSFNMSSQDQSNSDQNEFKPRAFSSEAMTSPPDLTPQEDTVSGNDSSHSQKLSYAQNETTLAKVSLMEARLNSIESKIDLITQVLLEEVSDETKKKLKLKSMMDRIR